MAISRKDQTRRTRVHKGKVMRRVVCRV